MHILFALLINPPPLLPCKNGYTRKQPIHFSMTPKFFFVEILNLKKSVCLKKMMPKCQAKNKTLFPQYPFLTNF